jgi:hypothetical protein
LALSVAVLVPRPAPAGPIAEQRQRLPPAPVSAECADPVSGTWRAHAYYPRQGQWYIFTLTIQRGDDKLSGQIDLRGWDGVPSNAEPQPCKPGFDDFTIIQTAEGRLQSGEVDFHGTSWREGPAACGHASGDYILDRFIGKIDEQLQEFQSVNRYPYHGEVVEDVTVFRRIQCPPPPGTPARQPGAADQPAAPGPPGVPTAPTGDGERRARFACGC